MPENPIDLLKLQTDLLNHLVTLEEKQQKQMERWSLAELTDCWVMRLLAGIDLSPGPFPEGKGRTDSVPDPFPSLQGGVRGRFLVVY